jgi:high-affinity Fe2+/Pb2+ permease
MSTPMYKHRPAYPALLGAAACLALGIFCYVMIYRRVESGDIGADKLLALIMISILLCGLFLVAAFSRYQFTHLWRKTSRRHHKHKMS